MVTHFKKLGIPRQGGNIFPQEAELNLKKQFNRYYKLLYSRWGYGHTIVNTVFLLYKEHNLTLDH